MSLLIQDALLVTVNSSDEVLQGDLLIDDGAIVSVGPRVDPSTARVDRIVDGRDFIVMPGLVNAHSHLASYLLKGLHVRRPLEIWRELGRAGRRVQDDRHLYAGTLMASLEMLRTGTTTVLDHNHTASDDPLAEVGNGIRALQESGIRAAVAWTIADRKFEETIPLDTVELQGEAKREAERLSAVRDMAGLEACQQFIERYHNASPRLTTMIGPSGPQRCTDATLVGCRELAERYDVGMHTHLLETKTQAVQCQRLYGKTAVQHLADLGFLSPRLSTAHSIWLKQRDISILAEHGVTPVHNPASNLRLGSGLAAVPEMFDRGLQVALGADGPTSNDTQNMFDAMRLAGLIHNLSDPDYERWLDPRQVVRMATINAARACQLADKVGSLEPGKRADVVLLRRTKPAFTPLNDVYGQLVLCENGSSVDTVLVEGQVVVEGGRSTLVDEDALARECEALQREIAPRIEAETLRTRTIEPSLRAMYLQAVTQPWSRTE